MAFIFRRVSSLSIPLYRPRRRARSIDCPKCWTPDVTRMRRTGPFENAVHSGVCGDEMQYGNYILEATATAAAQYTNVMNRNQRITANVRNEITFFVGFFVILTGASRCVCPHLPATINIIANREQRNWTIKIHLPKPIVHLATITIVAIPYLLNTRWYGTQSPRTRTFLLFGFRASRSIISMMHNGPWAESSRTEPRLTDVHAQYTYLILLKIIARKWIHLSIEFHYTLNLAVNSIKSFPIIEWHMALDAMIENMMSRVSDDIPETLRVLVALADEHMPTSNATCVWRRRNRRHVFVSLHLTNQPIPIPILKQPDGTRGIHMFNVVQHICAFAYYLSFSPTENRKTCTHTDHTALADTCHLPLAYVTPLSTMK